MIWPVLVNVWQNRAQVSRLMPLEAEPGGLEGTLQTEPARNWQELEQPARAFLIAAGAPTDGDGIAAGLYAAPPDLSLRARWD
jgi:hypothetical protein